MGDREVSVVLGFWQKTDKGYLPDLLFRNCNLYLANIGVDMILSYPWLKGKKMGIYPHLNALGISLGNYHRYITGVEDATKGGLLSRITVFNLAHLMKLPIARRKRHHHLIPRRMRRRTIAIKLSRCPRVRPLNQLIS